MYFINMKNPKTPWDVGRGVKLPPVWRPVGRGVTRRVWCFHRRGREP